MVALAMCIAPSAFAQDKQQCAAAYTRAQVLRAQSKLRDAKKLLNVCAADACPQALRKDCVPWLGEVEKSMPLLTVEVTDGGGNVLDDARVTVDGETVLASRATQLDPGDHVVSVVAPHFAESTKHVALVAGDAKSIRVGLAHLATPSPQEPAVKTVVPVAPIVLATFGAVGLGVFAGFGVAGNSIRSDLDAQNCKPNCPASRVDAIKSDYIAADVALGVGLAFVVVSTIMFIVSPWHETSKTALVSNGLAVRF